MRINIKMMAAAMAIAMQAVSASAQTESQEPEWAYIDAQELRIANNGWDDTRSTYTRLPSWLEDSVRADLWQRSRCSSGVAVRFATDSKRVGVRYKLLSDFHMIHMADTGTKGCDLYIMDDEAGDWRHVTCIRPYLADKEEKIVDKTFVERLDGDMHEYIMYLPLYDGVEMVEVKVDSGSVCTPGSAELIRPDKRVVAYGTSIMQGGCASRPGMASSNIIGREVNREVVNMGYSGEGKMDLCVARAMAQIPGADVFIVDPVPNCTAAMCDSLTYTFVRELRNLRPDAAIVMVEGPMYPYSRYDSYFGEYLPQKNANFRAGYERLKEESPERLYYVTCEDLDGVEDDGTVDGIHLTDLGFRHYADKLVPVIRQALAED